jgi:endonuclease YncB( thermonuclease family)
MQTRRHHALERCTYCCSICFVLWACVVEAKAAAVQFVKLAASVMCWLLQTSSCRGRAVCVMRMHWQHAATMHAFLTLVLLGDWLQDEMF